MKDKNSKEASIQGAPKRSFFSYLCPCFNFKSNHTLKTAEKHAMNNTEDSISTLQFNKGKSKGSRNEVCPDFSQDQTDKTEPNLKSQLQSGIYIKFRESENQKEQPSQYANMQEEYQRYLRQQNKPKPRYFPINSLKENHLIVVGNNQGRILCKVKSVFIEPSESSRKKQADAQKSKQKGIDPVIDKFWQKRYFLFQKFDQGIKLDQQSWFSVTPEAVAEHIGSRMSGLDTVLDGFCGAGGDSIKLALNCKRVISNDIDPLKIKLLENNAAVYGVDNIETTVSDFFQLQFKRNEFGAVYMSPPWGGPEYYKLERMMPEDFIPPLAQIISKSLALSDNVVLLLPKNTDIESISPLIFKAFSQEKIMSSCSIQLEKIYFEGNFKFIVLYIGSRLTKINLSDELQYIYRLLGDGYGPFRYKRVIKQAREKIGLLRLLNLIFQCEKNKKIEESIYQKLVAYLIQNEVITEEKLLKMVELDQGDSKLIQGKKSRKHQKKMIKSLKVQQMISNEIGETRSIIMTCNQARANRNIQSPLKKEKLDQTNSYVSSISDSKITSSIHFNETILYHQINTSGVKIEEISQTNIPKQ